MMLGSHTLWCQLKYLSNCYWLLGFSSGITSWLTFLFIYHFIFFFFLFWWIGRELYNNILLGLMMCPCTSLAPSWGKHLCWWMNEWNIVATSGLISVRCNWVFITTFMKNGHNSVDLFMFHYFPSTITASQFEFGKYFGLWANTCRRRFFPISLTVVQ